MFHSRWINHAINKLHERALSIAYKDHSSSLEEVISKEKSVTFHQRNLQILATEMYYKWSISRYFARHFEN